MTGIPPSPENLRAELARHQLTRAVICDVIGMSPNAMTNYLTADKEIPYWAGHNLGYGINRVTGLRIFNVEMGLGILRPRTKASTTNLARKKSSRPSVVLPVKRRKARRKTQRAS